MLILKGFLKQEVLFIQRWLITNGLVKQTVPCFKQIINVRTDIYGGVFDPSWVDERQKR